MGMGLGVFDIGICEVMLHNFGEFLWVRLCFLQNIPGQSDKSINFIVRYTCFPPPPCLDYFWNSPYVIWYPKLV